MARHTHDEFWCDVCGKVLDEYGAIRLHSRLSGVLSDWAYVPKELVFCEKCIHVVREGFASLFPHQSSPFQPPGPAKTDDEARVILRGKIRAYQDFSYRNFDFGDKGVEFIVEPLSGLEDKSYKLTAYGYGQLEPWDAHSYGGGHLLMTAEELAAQPGE